MNGSSDQNIPNRRNFLKQASVMAAAASAMGSASSASASGFWSGHDTSYIGKGETILFQGDSITDMGRSREHESEVNTHAALGEGYAWLAGAELLVGHPKENLRVYNRGVSGNKVYQLAERWQADCLDLKPDVLSILIGVNDIWHTLTGKYNGTVEVYERDYRALLARTLKALPKVKLILCEPFVLRHGAVTDKWFPEFDNYRAAAKRVAETFHARFVPFQTMFDEAVKIASPDYWTKDGVHPTLAGAALMANEWLKQAEGKS